MHRFLILACSERKRAGPTLLPALERYDGPYFRVVRRYLARVPSPTLEIAILSARFGLIDAAHPIPDYDQRMTVERALALSGETLARLGNCLALTSYDSLFVCAGRLYLTVLEGVESLLPATTSLRVAEGALGQKASQLHYWLYGQAPTTAQQGVAAPCVPGKIRLRGVQIEVSRDELLTRASAALVAGEGSPTRYRSWYVRVAECHVSPKWLVSLATGLAVSAFTADEARRVLTQLGIEVTPVAPSQERGCDGAKEC